MFKYMDNFLWLYITVGVYYSIGIMYYIYIALVNKNRYTVLKAVNFEDVEYVQYSDTHYSEN